MSTNKLKSIIFKIRAGCLIFLKNQKKYTKISNNWVKSITFKIGAELFDFYEGPNNANISTFFNE